jgi:hypothetical protein
MSQQLHRPLPELRPLDESSAKQASRVYKHPACGGSTTISGDDFVVLECPFRPVNSTYCCGCQKFVPLEAVFWADSGEKISDYRARLGSMVSFWRKLYLAVFCNTYQGAINLGLDRDGNIVQPLRDPAGAISDDEEEQGDEESDEESQKLQQLIQAGQMQKTYLRPLAWGGPDHPLNIAYLPPAAAAEKEEFEAQVAAEIAKGKTVQYAANFEYEGNSRLAARLNLKASGPGVNLQRTVHIARI